MFAVQATTPSEVIACTVPSFWSAKTSATPVALGTAGIIFETPDPLPGLDQITVPSDRVVDTVTSAVAPPALIVTCPTARAVSTGGSSVERLTMLELLDVQVNPVTGWLDAFSA
jgi:hypothetical protein